MAPTSKPSKPMPKPKEAPAPQAPAESTPAPQTSASQKTNTMAVVAIVLAFLIPFVGLILGIIALSQIKKRNEGGKGLAVASIIIAVVIMLVHLMAIGLFWGAIIAGKSELNRQGINVDTGTVEVKNKDGESASFGNAKIPSGFPSDVPIYPGSKVVYATKLEGDKYSVGLTSSDSLSKVQSFYSNELKSKGWTTGENTASYNFESGSASTFEKGSNTLLVTISSDKSNSESIVTLSVFPTKSQ